MVYEIIKHGKCYSVVNVETNKLHSRCSTMKNAKKQLRLLNAIDHGFKPTGKKKGGAVEEGITEWNDNVLRTTWFNDPDFPLPPDPFNSGAQVLTFIGWLKQLNEKLGDERYEPNDPLPIIVHRFREYRNQFREYCNGLKIALSGEEYPNPQSTEGGSLKRKVGLYSPSMRKLLSQVGNEPITSLKVVRTPIEKFIKGLLNVISLGKYSQSVKESGYDTMFHLALLINDKYQLDKQAVVVLAKKNPIKNTSETMEVKSIPDGLTIQSLIDKTKEYMGDEKFSNYDAHNNNCQDFLLAVLQSNNIINDELKSFIKQDVDAVFQKMPKISEKIAKVITDVGAVANKVVEGENVETKNIVDNKMAEGKTRKPNKWLIHVKKTMAMKKNKGKSFKQILQIAKSTYKK